MAAPDLAGTRTGFLQRIGDLPESVALTTDTAAAPRLTAMMTALMR